MPTNVEYDRDDRGYVFSGGLTNKRRNPPNRPPRPYGEDDDWAAGVPGTIYEHCDLGLERTILRQPVGPGTIGWVLFTSWHPLTLEQKRDFENGVNQWLKEDGKRKVGVFFGRDCTNAMVRRDVGIHEGPLLMPDPSDEQAWLWWRQNTDPLRNIGISEFWLDRGSANDSPATRKAIIKLARYSRLFHGTKIGTEAIPQSYDNAGEPDKSLPPDWDYIAKCPAMGRWRNLYNVWIKHGNYDLLAVPSYYDGKIEVHVNMNTVDVPPPTTGDAEWLAAHGWTISWKNNPVDLPDGPRTEAPEAGGPPDVEA